MAQPRAASALLVGLANLRRRLAQAAAAQNQHRNTYSSSSTISAAAAAAASASSAAASATPSATPTPTPITRPTPPPPRQHGSKVSVPADDDVLHELLVRPPPAASEGAVVGVRAYHAGAQLRPCVLADLARSQGRRVLEGGDWCLVWLQQPHADGSLPAGSARGGTADGASVGGRGAVGVENAGAGAKDDLSQPAPGPSPTSAAAGGPFLLAAYRHGGVALFGGSRRHDEAVLLDLPLRAGVLFNPRDQGEGKGENGSSSSSSSAAPLLDPPSQQQPQLLSEEYALHLDPRAPRFAQRLPDALLLRRLDVGAARVVSSILAQSVSLDHYRRAVDEYLDGFRRAKAAAAAAAAAGGGGRGGGGKKAGVASTSQQQEQQLSASAAPSPPPSSSPLSALARALLPRGALPGGLDVLLVRATASGALAAIEARRLLDICEPAWQRDDYHELWRAMEREFELERRILALERVISRQDDEARLDLAQRHGGRYHVLERAVIALLGVSCAIKLAELGIELL